MLEKRPSSLEAWRLLAEVSGMVGDYTNMENAIVDANNIYDKIIAKSVEDGIMVSRKAAAAIYHQLATSFMAVRYFEISEDITNSYVFVVKPLSYVGGIRETGTTLAGENIALVTRIWSCMDRSHCSSWYGTK